MDSKYRLIDGVSKPWGSTIHILHPHNEVRNIPTPKLREEAPSPYSGWCNEHSEGTVRELHEIDLSELHSRLCDNCITMSKKSPHPTPEFVKKADEAK